MTMQSTLSNVLRVLLILILCNRCNQEENKDIPISSISEDIIITYIKENIDVDLNDVKSITIIPYGGCGGCINSSITYIIDDVFLKNTKGVLVVFTDIQDFKKFKITVDPNKNILNHSSIIIDKSNELKSLGFTSFYPEIVLFKNGKIINRAFVTPENTEVFLRLNKHLMKL